MKPPGYPSDLQRHVTLSDGRRIYIRPIVSQDADALAEAIRTADRDTLYMRFMGFPPKIDDKLLRHLTEVDYHHRLALVAFDETGLGVAIVRYEGQPGSDEAEVAIAVRPEWRHVGVGTTLLAYLAEAAADRGIARFTAMFLADNYLLVELLRDAHVDEQRRNRGSGVVEDVIQLASRPIGEG